MPRAAKPLVAAGLFLVAAVALAQQPARQPTAAPLPAEKSAVPRLVPVAETKLVCEGVLKPNFDGLSKLLGGGPPDAEGWAFARGQALIAAEGGNLLLIRPPKTRPGQDTWVGRSVGVRDSGTKLGKAAVAKDSAGARAALAEMANQCNGCHGTFGVKVRLTPFEAGD